MDLKEKIQEFVDIAKACPENLAPSLIRPTVSVGPSRVCRVSAPLIGAERFFRR